MVEVVEDKPVEPEFDLGSLARAELADCVLPDRFTAVLPLPSIGRTNQHVDICSDLIDAAWVAEKLADFALTADATEEYLRESYTTRIRLTLSGIKSGMRNALADAILVFQGYDDEGSDAEDRYRDIRDSIMDFEDQLHATTSRFPEIVDHYYANLLGGGYDHYRSEAPEYYKEEMSKFPERKLGFFKSAYSSLLGANVFASYSSWMMPVSVSPDKFFRITGQPHRLSEFIGGRVFVIAGRSLIRVDTDLLWFPMNQYFKSRVCESLSLKSADEDSWDEPFAWMDASFTFSPAHQSIRECIPETRLAREPTAEDCLVHRSGGLIIVSDGTHYHYLYDTGFLNEAEGRRVFEATADLSESIGIAIASPAHIKCDWSSLDDELFEQLCYDLVLENPKFDSETIRKMGKSRSRDGGRDIVVLENKKLSFQTPRKWVFQCKLIRDGSSLTKTKMPDVGDMLEQYGANGFGVFTSAPIDATFYDSLDGLCRKRSIEQLHHSIFELERRLARYPHIRSRYFPASKTNA